ncbi:SacI homology domain-containing protein [Stachybotrys elegans]|uniref:phosphoinositide 5-phosphatase n=1 Tax=Stachybotrys elegans TaxID=80388 RepID=A0A8K0T057_9HYPO|nr:SacI homology domain-containing protein [Stachybotrys elegans]
MDHPPTAWSAQAPAPEKSCDLYIRDHPHRSIAIVSESHALILRYSSTASEAFGNSSHTSLSSTRQRAAGPDSSPVAKCMVEFAPISKQLLHNYRPLTSRPVYGTLGLIAVNNEVFISIITHAVRAATVRPGETVERIASVAFYCLSSADYDDVVPLESYETDVTDAASVYSQSSPYAQGLSRRDVAAEQHPCHGLRNLLSNGSFYYSTVFDLTNRVQDRPANSNSFDIDNFDDNYLWNSFMISPLVEFRSRLMPQEREALDASRFLTSAIRGFCKTMTIPQSASPVKAPGTGMPSFLTLISRLSCRRAGTRFNSRGIDDDGHVANFVESETTFWSPFGVLFSYSQVRGSVPVFWEQAADLIPGRQKITVTRSPDGTQPAFNKHFEDLEQTYGAVHIINLLSESKPGEVELSTLYRNGVRHCPLSRRGGDSSANHALLRETHYDFHAETKGPAGYEAAREIRRYIEDSTDGFAYYLAEVTHDSSEELDATNQARLVVVLQQEGVFRTNCLDCLDRTNLIQTLISQMSVEAFLGHRGEFATSDFWMRHSSLWADNGDSLSKIYAGTGALKTSFTRHGKMSLSGAVADMRKSVQRIYHNNFLDPSRQITIDMLLGRLVGQAPVHLFDPISDFVSVELGKRSDEFTSFQNISMWVGTFNLNGRTDGVDSDLSPWLFPPAMGSASPDIYVVGFQEIVELSPQQIMNSDPSRKQLWEQAVKRTLNQRQASTGGEKYVLLRSGQLVGAALCIFVKTSALSNIKNVEGSVKKTGLSGMAGNKGAVAIRFDYANTHICFVTAHLAAGFANYDERNRDYATIHHGLRFQRNRGIEDHDAIIWLGDFNYRIGLGLDAARALVRKRDLATLYENDQLNLQMVAGLAFPFYSEARITFMPTYKFDIGTDEYDTSEKARIPAWTDRILRKGPNLRQVLYDSAPLRFSDHRPVYAAFECKVNMVDEARRDAISRELYLRRKADVGDSAHVADADETDDEDLIGYDAIEPGLPAASSDRQKWWLDNKQPARADVQVPTGRDGMPMNLNPGRASNPFGASEEPDWISIPRSSSRASFTSISSSPYETVTLPQAMSSISTQAGRKLPPPFDPATLPAKVGRMQLGDERGSWAPKDIPDSAPPPPLPRRQTAGVNVSVSGNAGPSTSGIHRSQTQLVASRPSSSASQLTQQLRGTRPAPPVAKKPAHLATLSPTQTPTTPLHGDMTAIALNSSAASQGSRPTPGPNVIRKPMAAPSMNSSMSSMSPVPGGVSLPGFSNGSTAGSRSFPARRPVAADHSKPPRAAQGPMDLLDSLDEGGQDMGGWETLQPNTG